ncbi:cell growth regulator with EF hand domain protein 1 [Elgaria multicarinata webbii]|uniref:cell growth regulator with EF hand domain protein 1 n=1 Tax=Elgaria multicarinata webbii TaxID=159646 RepID=UPI002FCCF437
MAELQRLWLWLAAVLLLGPAGQAAPKDGGHRPEAPQDSRGHAILNPLHPGKESLRLLQDYLKTTGQVEGDAGAVTRQQALLLLFALHDYDRSGRLDGLEFMRLLNALATQQAHGQPTPDGVVLMVDRILESQDLNWDGLLEPSELLLPPRQGQARFAAPNEEDGAVLWPPPEAGGHEAPPSGPRGQEGTTEPPAAPLTVQEQGVMEAPSLSPLPQKHGGGTSQEALQDPQPQGAETPPAPRD